MDFNELRIFARVADLSSFSRAAEQLGLAKGHVSTAVQRLEARLGTRLLQRTTRTVRLTPDGEHFLVHCQELLAEAEQLQTLFQPAASGLTGRLRIDLPNILARDVVIPHLSGFLRAHPLLDVGISTIDRRVDLVHEGFDCVVRVGTLDDSDLVARPVGMMHMVNVASPAYLHAYGTPRTLADLAQHRVVHYAPNLSANDAGWEYFDEATASYRTVPMPATISVNGTDAYQAAALAGMGLIQAPLLGVRQLVAQGALVLVLPEFRARPMPVSLLFASRRQLAPRVQAVMNWLADLLTRYLAEPD
ncbi:DNA-binding transcriptional LysR family regulator [Actimicrobium sp. GrIS 1.19]|uniref:LysR family transcriptional regulator n=1 Tax=Actimicrobium sp. GrIS 1.19 TaxID=3071708 RepID=UPI002DFE9D31|nr:DNA-binding transcriptional LysR family regulator [Actimicrobium sp. GrIS 1.19]